DRDGRIGEGPRRHRTGDPRRDLRRHVLIGSRVAACGRMRLGTVALGLALASVSCSRGAARPPLANVPPAALPPPPGEAPCAPPPVADLLGDWFGCLLTPVLEGAVPETEQHARCDRVSRTLGRVPAELGPASPATVDAMRETLEAELFASGTTARDRAD